MDLSNLKPADGSTHSNRRLGRGQASGRGRTSTRGHKGAKSRSGYKMKRGFEGGQMPLQRRVPKYGFKNPNRIDYKPINLDLLQQMVDSYKLESIGLEELLQHGMISNNDHVKVLGRGELNAKIKVTAHAFSASAKEAIEKQGGEAVIV